MPTERKTRADAKLKTLPESRQTQLAAWLRVHPQKKVRELVKTEWGLDTSGAALTHFYSWWHGRRRLEETASFVEGLKRDLASLPGLQLSERQVSEAGQLVFEALALKQGDPRLFMGLRRLRLSADAQQIDLKRLEQTIRAYEEKQAAAKAALETVTAKGGLTPETLAKVQEALSLL
jgi:hypothetical protein